MSMSATATMLLGTLLDVRPGHSGGGSGGGGSAIGGLFGALLGLVIAGFVFVVFAIMIASMWRIFTKAGETGWMAIIPILNMLILLKITGKPVWWIVLLLIPGVNLIAAILLKISLAEVFGEGVGFAIGLLLLPIIFYPMLAFGSSTYRRPVGAY